MSHFPSPFDIFSDCANIFNPEAEFLDVPEDECLGLGAPCPGNRQESCGIPSAVPIADVPIATHIFFNLDSPFNCTDRWWDRLAPLTPLGSWRFSYFYKYVQHIHFLQRYSMPFQRLNRGSCTASQRGHPSCSLSGGKSYHTSMSHSM